MDMAGPGQSKGESGTKELQDRDETAPGNQTAVTEEVEDPKKWQMDIAIRIPGL
jgi:hypothetical protein